MEALQLVTHAYCVIEEVEPGMLQCTTKGRWITRLTFAAAGFFLLGGLASFITMLITGTGTSNLYQLLFFPLVFGVSGFLFWHAHLRNVETNPENYHGSVSGFLAEIDRMQLERTIPAAT